MISSTIVALASPPGIGALHVIRMSGPNAFSIINSVSLDKVEKTVDRLQVTFIKSRNNMLIDQVVLMKFYSPFSYTGEDCIEISCHGNGLISKLIIDELIKNGARYAERGEFTKRAFLNNKIDLNQAMNIGNLFKASSEVDIYSSVQEIRGATSAMINGYLDDLLSLIGECELNIDYPPEIHEDDLFLENVQIRIKRILSDLEHLYLSSKKQKLSNFRVVFVGKPNAGKSSLINYLIGKDRIIVSDRAGTTTDSIEIDFCIDGYILTLVDTAGIENITDEYEYTEKSKQEIKNSDLLIHLSSCEDSGLDEFWDSQLKGKDVIKIITKNDLMQHKPNNSISVKNDDVEYFYVQIKKFLFDNYVSVGIKSLDNINNLNDSILELKKSLSTNIPVDLVSEHLRNAYDHLSLIVKKTLTNEDKINSMFDNFCVGK